APTPRLVWQMLPLSHKLLLGYLFATVLSVFLSEYRATAIWGSGRCEGLVAITLYVLSFMLVSVFAEPKRWMLWLFAAAISINCLVCLIQFAGYNPFHLYPEGMNYYDANKQYAGEFLGTIGNGDILSAVLSLSIPAFWSAFLRLTGDRRRFLLLIPLVLCLVVLLKAFVSGGILGVGGALVISVPVMLDGKVARKRATVVVACGIVLLAVSVYLFGGSMGGFLYEASELMHGHWNDDFGSGRLYIWRNVLQLVPEHPLFGGGPDTLGLRTDAAFERYDETLDLLIHSSIDTAHNEYLNILVNQGAIALAFYLAALAASAVRWVRHSTENPVVAISGCAILGYCIQAFFGISSPISTPFFWMALAFLNPMQGKENPLNKSARRSK
ncbi:MAG: O-antigen ligase family protein, partial [Bacteroidales bacterium]|nr:O-antigen ligase family protein [Bacteroidales bacterium]